MSLSRDGATVSGIARLKAFAATALLLGAIEPFLAQTAHAGPLGFPDLNAFQSVDPAPYTAAPRGGGGTYFSTPDGLSCLLPAPYHPGQHMSASCGGHIPGLPAGTPTSSDGCSDVGTGAPVPTDLGPYKFSQGTGCAVVSPYNPPPKLLNAGQKISRGDLTCVVGADRLTACIDPILNRGFVLRPSGSMTF